MILEVLPKENCSDCVFCEETIYCKLLDGEPIDYVDEWTKPNGRFCPLQNGSKKVTDKVRVLRLLKGSEA